LKQIFLQIFQCQKPYSLTLLLLQILQIPLSSAIEILENRTKLVELLPKNRLLLIDSLNIDTILSLNNNDELYLRLAEDAFKRKYSQKVFKIVDPVRMGFDDIQEVINVVYVRQYGEILRLLKYYGHLITKLSIVYSQYPQFGGVNMAPIIKYVNTYCNNNLIEFDLTINSDYMEVFDKMTKPFKQVKKLSLCGKYNKMASSTLSFDDLFPALRSLSLKYIQVHDKSNFDYKFPHLKHLYVEIGQSDKTRFTEDDVEKMIMTNSHIQSLKLGRCDMKMLKIVSEILLDLESLQLVSFINFHHFKNDERIVFNNVKYFSVVGQFDGILEYVEFKNLTEFHIIGSPSYYGNWIDFIAKNPHLKILSVQKTHTTGSELKRLTELNLNLAEISLSLNHNVEYETIADFVRKNENITKIELTIQFSSQSIAEALQKEFGKIWSIIRNCSDLESRVTLQHH